MTNSRLQCSYQLAEYVIRLERTLSSFEEYHPVTATR